MVETRAVDALVTRVTLTAEELSGADAVVLLTDHAAFDFAEIAKRSRYVLDCRHVLEPGDNIETL